MVRPSGLKQSLTKKERATACPLSTAQGSVGPAPRYNRRGKENRTTVLSIMLQARVPWSGSRAMAVQPRRLMEGWTSNSGCTWRARRAGAAEAVVWPFFGVVLVTLVLCRLRRSKPLTQPSMDPEDKNVYPSLRNCTSVTLWTVPLRGRVLGFRCCWRGRGRGVRCRRVSWGLGSCAGGATTPGNGSAAWSSGDGPCARNSRDKPESRNMVARGGLLRKRGGVSDHCKKWPGLGEL
mmetsp:Transcript_82526/g.145585  ORF Transcript_82526/g.145585 Transcript_82526/m.145585 type:complete len:236 (-) Transcript_82526:796-1503(-)